MVKVLIENKRVLFLIALIEVNIKESVAQTNSSNSSISSDDPITGTTSQPKSYSLYLYIIIGVLLVLLITFCVALFYWFYCQKRTIGTPSTTGMGEESKSLQFTVKTIDSRTGQTIRHDKKMLSALKDTEDDNEIPIERAEDKPKEKQKTATKLKPIAIPKPLPKDKETKNK